MQSVANRVTYLIIKGVKHLNRVRTALQLDKIYQQGYVGEGVTTVIFDTGVNHKHPDLKGQVLAFLDCVNGRRNCYDDNGHGTHIAGILAGTGVASRKKYQGVAPGGKLVIVKILDANGNGKLKSIIQGIDWVLCHQQTYHIKIANISLGAAMHMRGDSELVKKVEDLWDAGIVVCVAAGNQGPELQSIGAPGNSRKVITVGVWDDEGVEMHGRMVDGYSGRGPTVDCIKKPDVVTMGSNIMSCNGKGTSQLYTRKSGTSMATPIVSGSIALLLQRYPHMTTREVKIRIKETAISMGLPHFRQGWGKLNVMDLMR